MVEAGDRGYVCDTLPVRFSLDGNILALVTYCSEMGWKVECSYVLKDFTLVQNTDINLIIAVATTEASSDFLKIMGISPQKEPTGVILVSFDHFTSSDFNGWLRSC